AAGQEHQLVRQLVAAQVAGRVGAAGGDERADPAHVVVAEEGGQPVRAGVGRGVEVVGGVQGGQSPGRAPVSGERLGGRLEGEVQDGGQAAAADVGGLDLLVGAVDLAEHEEVL